MTGVNTTLRCDPVEFPEGPRTMLVEGTLRMLVAIPRAEVVRQDSTQLVHRGRERKGLGQLPRLNESPQEVSHSRLPALTTRITTTDTLTARFQIVQKSHEDCLADFPHLPLPRFRVDQ